MSDRSPSQEQGCASVAFDYDAAFSRNIGWVTEAEQRVLRSKQIAIAGLGGVGGAHLLTLARLGVGHFAIADFDRFDIVNVNRQAGATTASLGRPKTEVLAEQARLINPDIEFRIFREGVTPRNIDAFLSNADCYLDGLDFFAFGAREMTFAACSRLAVPAVTAAPIGMGAAVLTFLPGHMNFEQYFCLQGCSDTEKAARLIAGLTPAMLHRGYLVDPSRVNLGAAQAPSTAMACQMCAGIAATQALKILLNRGPLLCAPWAIQYDAYTNRAKTTWRPGGNRNPLQRVLIALARHKYRALEPKSLGPS
jgi:molybdopterin/thiamine biosynthesis adenylyltransferase